MLFDFFRDTSCLDFYNFYDYNDELSELRLIISREDLEGGKKCDGKKILV